MEQRRLRPLLQPAAPEKLGDALLPGHGPGGLLGLSRRRLALGRGRLVAEELLGMAIIQPGLSFFLVLDTGNPLLGSGTSVCCPMAGPHTSQ